MCFYCIKIIVRQSLKKEEEKWVNIEAVVQLTFLGPSFFSEVGPHLAHRAVTIDVQSAPTGEDVHQAAGVEYPKGTLIRSKKHVRSGVFCILNRLRD